MIEQVLEDNGYATMGAVNGQDALEKLQRAAVLPCLILLDIMMPIMDGWQFRAAQRRDAKLAQIPVIVISAHASAQQAAAEMAVDGFLRKPLQLQTLLATIERFCPECQTS